MFDVLDDLETAIDKLAADEGVVDVERISQLVERLEFQRLRTVGAYDRSCGWAAEGFVSTSSALRAKLRCSHSHAFRSVRLARKLASLGEVAAAFNRGEVTAEHVVEIAHGYTPARAAMIEGIESELVAFARIGTPGELRDVVRSMTDAFDGDGGAGRDKKEHDLNGVTLSSTTGGRGILNGSLDAEATDVVLTALDAEMEVLRTAGETRKAPELRSAALIRAETAHGGTLSRSTIERLSCDCKISRVIMDGPSCVLDVGRTTRNVSNAQWNALVARDRHCQGANCARGPGFCEAHHVWHWEHGGPTNLDNLKLLCWYCHRKQHIADARARPG